MKENKRPEWCPHPDCIFKMNTQDLICSGDLPKPEAHDNDFNDHRICTDERETGHGVHDLQINRTDAWHFKRHMERILALTKD